MQPTFLPWSGYFHLMSEVDIFIFLDDAQFQKSSWHNRNRIPLNNAPHWLTVPVLHQQLEQTLLETRLKNTTPWREKMTKLLEQAYAKHSFNDEIGSFIELISNDNFTSLAELNIALIKIMSQKLGIKCQIIRSSELDIPGIRTQRLISILHSVNATEYLSPQGAREYLIADGFTEQTSISLSFQQFTPQVYPQRKADHFIEKLSMLDVVMNIGWCDSKAYITQIYLGN
ncbi:WbqC family protein [Shewanella sp. ULN5]|uniref:WbqC family protein n=1 Tax=Shewanella sp. ULN5 TaxID=2994678 RepID=UPI00273FE4F2|nr:WbqC family protein [Shewanella sp. ULN5]MDP5144995.1 WbqC family protein [Shewanella sp. ULN5]